MYPRGDIDIILFLLIYIYFAMYASMYPNVYCITRTKGCGADNLKTVRYITILNSGRKTFTSDDVWICIILKGTNVNW